MAEYRFKAISQEHLHCKVEAARELFGKVDICAQGQFVDHHGEPIFFDHTWKKFDQVGATCCEVEVDGWAAFVTPTQSVDIKITW